MAFDFTLAIARMQDCDKPTSAELRQRYPELGFLFDELDDLRAGVRYYGDPAELAEAVGDRADEAAVLYDLAEEAQDRFAQLRDLMLTLQRFDAAEGIQSELGQAANLADDAIDFIEKRKGA